MTLTPITITFASNGQPVLNPDGGFASGALVFTLCSSAGDPITIEDSTTGETVLPTPIVASVYQGQLLHLPVGGGPYTPFTLIANDDPTTTPTGTFYLVHEQLLAGNVPDWPFTVHHAASGGTQTIASQRP